MQATSTLLYLTGNRYKFEIAQQALQGSGIVLEQTRLPAPEIQSNSVQDIAEFTAQWASPQLDQSFIVTDAGFYIDALNGFPGPFIKYVNQWFSVEDLLLLMHNKTYRHISVNDCLVYVCPGEASVSFLGSFKGKIATMPGQNTGTPIERLFIPDGYEVPISELSTQEQRTYWCNGEMWQTFRTFYVNKSPPDQV